MFDTMMEPPTPTGGPPKPRQTWRLVLLVAATVVAATAGVVIALQLFDTEGTIDVSQLAEHEPSIITRIQAHDGQLLAEFAEERRIVVGFDQIPNDLRQAIVAVEDADFFDHWGLNLRGIFRAAIANARAGRVVEGGSSLTQQLAKVMFLTPERRLRRKFREAVLALNLEATYSKEEILTFYLNQVYLGHNRYGVEAAAQHYFGKHVWDLELHESALLAGLPQRPAGYSPYRSHDAALTRRNHVLARLRAVGYINDQRYEEATRQPLVLRDPSATNAALGPYFVEDVRQYLEQSYGVRGLYHQGLNVKTTLDPRLQAAAQRALADGLLALDHRHGWRAPENILAEGRAIDSFDDYRHPRWHNLAPEIGGLVPGLVTAVGAETVQVRVGPLRATVGDAPQWTRKRHASELFRVGDISSFRVLGLDPVSGRIELAVEQEPAVEGALVALEVGTGRILAMAGGWDFARSKFNRAHQAKRQTGSAFKPLLYAAAIQSGMTATDTLFDEPIAITDEDTGVVYSPENHGGEYHGLTTVREALEKSRNPFSVMLLQRIGYEPVISLARRLGLQADLKPYPSLALGAFEVSLLEMTAAYGAFANHGAVSRPYSIEQITDRSGQILKTFEPASRPALSPQAAYITARLMQGVVESGTGRRARSLGRVVAGKTGTTDKYMDAWFIGFSPHVVAGVWVGYDQKKSLGHGEEGSRAALPIWVDFMSAALLDSPADDDFTIPSDIELVMIDKDTGLRATDSCHNTFREVFVRGTAPVNYCSTRDHELRALPYYLQKIYLADARDQSLPDGHDIAPAMEN